MSDRKQFKVEIEADGMARITLGDMGGIHHKKAEEFLKVLQELMGGDSKEIADKKAHTHTHHNEGEQHVHH